MGIITLPIKESSKLRKFFCPHADDSDFCLGTCKPHYVCDLPVLDSKKRKTKASFSKCFKKKKIELGKLEKQAERQLRWAHGDRELI